MRVKLGNTWYEMGGDTPICIEFDKKDLELIRLLDPEGDTYMFAQISDSFTVENARDWMNDKFEI